MELITTVAGNTPSETGAQVAKDLLVRFNTSIPVVQGATQALQEDPVPWRAALDNRVPPYMEKLWHGGRASGSHGRWLRCGGGDR